MSHDKVTIISRGQSCIVMNCLSKVLYGWDKIVEQSWGSREAVVRQSERVLTVLQ